MPLTLPWAFDSDERIMMMEDGCIDFVTEVPWVVHRPSRLLRLFPDPALEREGYVVRRENQDVNSLAGSACQTDLLLIL